MSAGGPIRKCLRPLVKASITSSTVSGKIVWAPGTVVVFPSPTESRTTEIVKEMQVSASCAPLPRASCPPLPS